MKKRIVALLLCVCMAVTAAGCGKTKDGNAEGTETAGSTETVSFTDIEYDAADYVTVGDYEGLDVTIDDDYAVTDSDVADYVNTSIIASYPYYTDSDKTNVEDGDYVNIDYTGTKDGEEFSGGSGTNYTLQIGSDTFIDGFEDGLIGLNVGDETDLNLTFPEDYSSTELAGQDVVFHVTINKIQDKQDITYDTLTDDYVTYLSDQIGADYENVDDMVTEVKDYLQSSNDSDKQTAIRTAVIAKLKENCTVDKLPDGLLDARMAEVLKQYDNYYSSYYTDDVKDLEAYVEANFGTTYEDFLTEIESEVTSDINTQLILEAIAQKEDIELVDDDFQTYVDNLVSTNGYDSEDTLYEQYASTAEDGKKYLQTVYVCNQALQIAVDSANVTVADSTETETPQEGTEAAASTEAE